MKRTYIGNLRGPRGFSATGAAEDDQAVSEFVGVDGTATNDQVRNVAGAVVGLPKMRVHNVNATTLPKWRAAMARAAGGGVSARLGVSGDSIAWGAGSGGLFLLSSWPGRLQRMFNSQFGPSGTGMMPLWHALGTSGLGDNNWIFRFNGSVSNVAGGVYGPGAKRVTKTGTTSWIEFGPIVCDTIRVYCASEGGVGRAVIDGTTAGIFRTNTASTGETYPMLAGYASGLAVTDIPMGSVGKHTLRIYPELGTDSMTVVGIEAINSEAPGVRVSNVALSSQTTQQLVVDDATLGKTGMSVGIDAIRSDLLILPWGVNDWQQHYTVASFKSRMLTAINRQRTSTPVANGGTTANGDALMIAPHWPDFAAWPPDHVLTPSFQSYIDAMYELSDSEGVGLIDFSGGYENYADWAAQGFSFDGLHLSALGSEAYAAGVHQVLTSVA